MNFRLMRIILIVSVLAFLDSGLGWANTFVAPGSSGTISFPIWNHSNSAAAFPSTVLAVSAPSIFQMQGTSSLGPVTILPGATYTFNVDFAIDSGAPSGDFNCVLTVGIGSSEVFQINDQLPLSTTVSFTVDSETPQSTNAPAKSTTTLPDVFGSTNCLRIPTSAASGIASINVTFPGIYSSTQTFSCSPPATSVEAGSFCGLAAGGYTETITSCVGLQKVSTFTVTAGAPEIKLTVFSSSGTSATTHAASLQELKDDYMQVAFCMGVGDCAHCRDAFEKSQMGWPSGTYCCAGSSPGCGGPAVDFGGSPCCRTFIAPYPVSGSYSISGSTPPASDVEMTVHARFFNRVTSAFDGDVRTTVPHFIDHMSADIDLSEYYPQYPLQSASPSSTATVYVPFVGPALSTATCASSQGLLAAILRLVLRTPDPCYRTSLHGSDLVFVSTAPLSFSYQDASADTTTLRIYRFDGVSLDSTVITNQSVSKDTTTNVVSLSGEILQGGEFIQLYQGRDSSAPITSPQVVGSSYVFDGTVFFSTDTQLILASTDPVVNGFASQVATSYYRIDPANPADPWNVYTTTLPILPGPYILEYRSVDFAGNREGVHTSTFIITAGSVTKFKGKTSMLGNLLVGSYPLADAKAALQARGEDYYSLKVSSADGNPLLTTTNLGTLGLGEAGITAHIDVPLSGTNSIGLQLRAGNSTSSVSSDQIAFGYNGDIAMRHLIRTEHSTGTTGNRMDFLVWSPVAGSTTALAGVNVLSIQQIAAASGGSVHVHPAGEPDVEVEVSNGSGTGQGSVAVLASGPHSSRELKSDIRELSEAEQKEGADAVLALKPATFRYRNRAGSAYGPVVRGLIYEDVPPSIQGKGSAVIIDDRVANLELLIQRQTKRLRQLQSRLQEMRNGR